MSKKIIAVVMLVLLIPFSVAGAGLGKIKIKSSLGEPLDADIELVESPADEVAKLTAKVASADDYAAAGLSDAYIPPDIHVQVTRGADNTRMLHLSSDRPINEPFIELLIKAESPNSNFLRQYTLLLDPPMSRVGEEAGKSQASNSPLAEKKTVPSKIKMVALSAENMSSATLPDYVPQKSRPSSRRPGKKQAINSVSDTTQHSALDHTTGHTLALPTQALEDQSTAERYTTQPGDVFGKVAQRYQPEGVSLKRVMAAFFAANPEAFVNGDINQLKAGQSLRIPSQQAMTTASGTAGRRDASERQPNKPQQANPPVKAEAVSGQEIAVRPQVASKFVLKISPGDADKLDTAPEQQQAQQPATSPASAASADASSSASSISNSSDSASAASPSASNGSAANTSDVTVPALATSSTPPSDTASRPLTATPTAAEPPSFLNSLMSNLAWIGLGMVIPLVFILALYVLNKRRFAAMQGLQRDIEDDIQEDEDFFVKELPGNIGPSFQKAVEKPLPLSVASVERNIAGTSAYGSEPYVSDADVGEQDAPAAAPVHPVPKTAAYEASALKPAVDEAVVSSKTVNVAPIMRKADESDIHEVDPLVEAEIYLSYGRSEQAENILKNALAKTPNKHEISLGLLKIYADRADLQAFERVALGVKAAADLGNKEDLRMWEMTQALGLSIDPQNALYQSADRTQDAAVDAEIEHSPMEHFLQLPPLDGYVESESELLQPEPVKSNDTKTNILEFTLDEVSTSSTGKASAEPLDADELFAVPESFSAAESFPAPKQYK